MMSIIAAGLKRVFQTRQARVLHECRHCGTNVSYDVDQCPECDSTDIVQYEII